METAWPSVWLPTIRAGTGADVFTLRLCDALNASGVRAEITWLPHRAEVMPWSAASPSPPAWANVAHVNSWLPRRFWPRHLPVVVTVHHLVHDPAYAPYRSATQAAYHRSLIRPRELAAIRDAAAVTTVSDYVRGTVMDFAGRQDITTIHNWVDTARFTPLAETARPSHVPFRLFIAGSASRRKGIDLLPTFARALCDDFQIRYAGGNASGCDGLSNVILLGRISDEDMLKEFQHCDAVVSLSRYEGFGYTALEAMACGKPFLGFSGSALTEVVPNDCGYLVPMEDVGALAAACQRLQTDHQHAVQLGARGRQHALSRFSQQAALQSYLTTYCAALGTRR